MSDENKSTSYFDTTKYSIIDKEIVKSLQYFTQLNSLHIDLADIHNFLTKDKQRRSICVLGQDTILHICSYIRVSIGLQFLRSNKQMTSYIPMVWKTYETVYYTYSTLNASPAITKINIGIDWFNSSLKQYRTFRTLVEQIHKFEKTIVVLEKRNKYLSSHTSCEPLPQTKIEYATNIQQIESYNREIDDIYRISHAADIDALNYFRWLSPSGYICDIPEIDTRIYGCDYHEEDGEYDMKSYVEYDMNSDEGI